jgi:hypothetical protein
VEKYSTTSHAKDDNMAHLHGFIALAYYYFLLLLLRRWCTGGYV